VSATRHKADTKVCQQLGVRQTNDAHRSSVPVSPKYLDEVSPKYLDDWPDGDPPDESSESALCLVADTHCDESSEPAEKLLLNLPITLRGVGDMLAGVAGVAGVAGAFVAAAAAECTCCTDASFES
jgi:hypothetical protein